MVEFSKSIDQAFVFKLIDKQLTRLSAILGANSLYWFSPHFSFEHNQPRLDVLQVKHNISHILQAEGIIEDEFDSLQYAGDVVKDYMEDYFGIDGKNNRWPGPKTTEIELRREISRGGGCYHYF